MIIYPNKAFVTRHGIPNENSADKGYKHRVLVIDDNSELGRHILSGGEFDIEVAGGKVIDAFVIENDIEHEPPENLIPSSDEIERARVELLVA